MQAVIDNDEITGLEPLIGESTESAQSIFVVSMVDNTGITIIGAYQTLEKAFSAIELVVFGSWSRINWLDFTTAILITPGSTEPVEIHIEEYVKK
jgi:hypothetical protein